MSEVKIPAWSHTSLTKFETCPRQYWLVRVAKKVVDVPGEQALWGQRVHKALELRVKDGTPLPDGMQKWEPICARILKTDGKLLTEQKMALDKNLRQVEWFAPTCWMRGVLDLSIEKNNKAVLFDYKTGKMKPDNDQLKLFAGMFMSAKPHIEKVTTGFIWLVNGKTTNAKFTRDDLPAIWQEYSVRSQRLDAAYQKDRWIPNPSGLCAGWCPAGRENCEFWSPKRR